MQQVCPSWVAIALRQFPCRLQVTPRFTVSPYAVSDATELFQGRSFTRPVAGGTSQREALFELLLLRLASRRERVAQLVVGAHRRRRIP